MPYGVQAELLVVASPPIPLVNLGTICRGYRFHIDYLLAVLHSQPVMRRLHPLDPEDLILAAPVIPLGGVGAVGRRYPLDVQAAATVSDKHWPPDRIQAPDSLQIVWSQHPVGRVRRHRREHDSTPDARVRESEQVADFMECDCLDVVLVGYGANAPSVFLVVEMEWPGDRVPIESAAWGLVGMRKDSSGHVGGAAVRLRPRHQDGRVVSRSDLAE